MLHLNAIGNDPMIHFPLLPLQPNNEYIIHLNMTSSVQSTVQVFYSIAGQTGYRFSEQNSLRFPVKKGKNDIYISLDYPKPGKHLRLDPITGLGEILIKTVEVRKVKKATRTVRKGAA